ncbi:MAG TPA: malto-oligosyltrehalose synthase [Rhizomicrobium sp.]|jgi:(1->4)-alpha-D-glucan 1-alpha-D-glucosylmutase
MIPRATYRLQLHKDFTFADAARQAGYFQALGISHVYTSPILTARAGSLHGYDVVDHCHINPELGGEDGFRAMAAIFKAHDLGLIIDIVPNHMAVGQADNSWWLELLEKGRASTFAAAFDIDWDMPGLEDKVLAPFLDGAPDALWQKGELKLLRDPMLGKWAFAYFGHRFPLRPQDQRLTNPPTCWSEASALLAQQNFVLSDWREADNRINWRRFFDITELAAIRIAEPAVFEAVHSKILSLYGEGLIDGVRVDHIDGLADPAGYCHVLQRRLWALRTEPYLVVEKILADGEMLPDWPVHGTTGYEVMNDISALQHAQDDGALETLWQQVSGRDKLFEDEEKIARREIVTSKFAAQLAAAARSFAKLMPNVPYESLRHDLAEVIVSLRCYRGYQTGGQDSPIPDAALSRALEQAPHLRPVFEMRDGDPQVVDALRRFHQLTAPVAAKAVEDTAFYRYGRLLSRNDVGFNPRNHFLSPQHFHDRVSARLRDFPHGMLTTGTHDHKRGEDTRARLAALSAHARQWEDLIAHTPDSGPLAAADVYTLYQTLVGTWPDKPDSGFADRIDGWCRKALREAKLRSTWQAPDIRYEDAMCHFARDLILGDSRTDFRRRLTALLTQIAATANHNTLVQTVLRCTLPGVPDLYQGAEFCDFSLVDPDNRRPVDYTARHQVLAEPLTADSSLDHRKQKIVAALLTARRHWPNLWHLGNYEPVPTENGAIAFIRHQGAVSLCVIARCNSQQRAAGSITLERPACDILTSRKFAAGTIAIESLLAAGPAAVLIAAD